MEEYNEKELIIKAKDGDAAAFEKLIEGYQKKVFNLAFRMLGNYDDAAETAQEVFIKIYRSLKSFREDSLFSTWVFSITKNLCLDQLRKSGRDKVVYLDEPFVPGAGAGAGVVARGRSGGRAGDDEDGLERQIPDKGDTVEEIVEKNEAKRLLEEGIRKLSPEHRLMIVMRDIQGFSYEEIAKVTKCSEGTVKSRISRARLSLRAVLKDHKEMFYGG